MEFIEFVVLVAFLLGVFSLFGWPVPLFLAFRALRKGGPGARRRGVGLLTLSLAMVAAAGWVVNSFLQARDSATRASCACSLGALGAGLAVYADTHGGKPAPDLDSVARGGLGPNYLVCPLGSRYAYRPVMHPKPDDVVAWDSKPHPHRRRMLFFVTAWRRNVVCADGTRRSLTEEEFHALQRKWKPQSVNNPR